MGTAKYKIIVDDLKRKIESEIIAPGGKLKTESELSKEYEVSRQTIRNAIQVLTDEGVVYSRQGSGTYVKKTAPFVSDVHSYPVGMITTYASYYIFPDILNGIEETLRAGGHQVLLSVTHQKVCVERSILKGLLNQNIAGLIVECTQLPLPNPNLDLYREFQRRNIPILFINGHYRDLENTVYLDTEDQAGGALLARYFLSRGMGNMGGVMKTDLHGNNRYYGWMKTQIDAGIEVDEKNYMWFSDMELRKNPYIDYYGKLERLSKCDALLCYNDITAINIYNELKKIGADSMPRLACFDNTALLQNSDADVLALTNPARNLGRRAAEKIMNMINGGKEANELMPWLNADKFTV